MNRRVIWILSLAIAMAAALVCSWRLYGESAESSEQLRKPRAVGQRAGISEGQVHSGLTHQPVKPMSDPIDDLESTSVLGRIGDTMIRLRDQLRGIDPHGQFFVDEDGTVDVGRASPLLSREEWIFRFVASLVVSVRNDSSFGYNGWEGYRLRNCLREIGAGRWAELFERLSPFVHRIEEIEGERQEGKVTEDEYFNLVDPINEEMDAIEAAADVESCEEVELLLLKYAVKHGFAAPNAPEGSRMREDTFPSDPAMKTQTSEVTGNLEDK